MSAAGFDPLLRLWRDVAATLPADGRASRLLTVARTMTAQGAGAELVPVSLCTYLDGAALLRLLEALAELRGRMTGSTLSTMVRGAVRQGLWRLAAPEGLYFAADFTPKVCPTLHSIEVELEPPDALRVACIAVAFGVDPALVASAALCTGAAMLAGVDERIAGPFAPPAAPPLRVAPMTAAA